MRLAKGPVCLQWKMLRMIEEKTGRSATVSSVCGADAHVRAGPHGRTPGSAALNLMMNLIAFWRLAQIFGAIFKFSEMV